MFRIELAENQHELLKEFGKIKGFDDTVLTAFHRKLRKIGNQAVHEYHNDLQDAEMCLRISYRLAIWFYRLVKKEFDFAAPVFVLPTSAQSNDYSQEVAALKEALKLAQQHETQTKEEFELQQAKLASLAGYISILESKQEETEEQSKARIAALEVKLQEKEAELQQKTEAERKVYKQQINDAVGKRSLELVSRNTLSD